MGTIYANLAIILKYTYYKHAATCPR
jgi:hypothetical protein